MTIRRDGTPQTFNPSGMMQTTSCPDCGMVMRRCNLSRHARARHDPTYIPPSRTAQYRRIHRTHVWSMNADRRGYYSNDPGVLYVLHFSRPLSDHASHYMGWTANLPGRLVAHGTGQGSRLTRAAVAEGISFALTWTAPGTRTDEARIKRGRKLATLCSLCRKDALADHARKMRERRAREVGAGGTAERG